MKFKHFLKDKSPAALAILGCVGVAATAIFTAKATPKALELMKDAEKKKGDTLTSVEKIQVAAIPYLPAAGIGIATILCISGANILNKRKQATVMSAYVMADQVYKDYVRKVKELHGEEMHNEIINAIAVEKAEKVDINAYLFCEDTSAGFDEKDDSAPILFYDAFSERFFESTLGKVMQAEYHLNRNYILGGEAVVNEFYELLGLSPIKGGDDLGWAPVEECEFWIEFSHRKEVLADGTGFYILDMPWRPRLNYWEEEEY